MTKKIVYRTGIKADYSVETVEDITLYVRADGSDSNTGLSEIDALATIQGAINRLPRHIEHPVTIDVGEGTFSQGFNITGFTIADVHDSITPSLKIKGVLGNPTLTTGTTSGTATGGTTITLIDSGQNWTSGELKGKIVYIDNSDYVVIRDNDSTTLYLASKLWSSTNGKSYVIYEPKTIIKGQSPGGFWGAPIVVHENNVAYKRLILENLDVQVDINYGFGFYIVSSGLSLKNTVIKQGNGTNISQGIIIQTCNDKVSFESIYINGTGFSSSSAGINAMNCKWIDNISGLINGVYKGLLIQNINLLAINASVVNCTGNGAYFTLGCPDVSINYLYSANNTGHGIYLYDTSISISELVGSGNGLYGLAADQDTYIYISSASITGSSGDFSLGDIGSFSWSTDLGTSGDYISVMDRNIKITKA